MLLLSASGMVMLAHASNLVTVFLGVPAERKSLEELDTLPDLIDEPPPL